MRSGVLCALWLLGCTRPEASPTAGPAAAAVSASVSATAPASASASASASAPASPAAAAVAPPITADADLIDLPLGELPAAVVSVPRGATPPRPVVIAAHGNYDTPSWQCGSWREIVGDRAFILCPRGMARPDSPSPDDVRFQYASNTALEAEVQAGLAALKARFGAHVADGPVLWTGFSQGAIMGVPIAERLPQLFPRLVLLEGGHDAWTAQRAKAFADGGGRRVIFACGQKGCAIAARAAAQRLERAGIGAKVVLADGQGHSYGGEMSRLAGAELGWLLEGDARW